MSWQSPLLKALIHELTILPGVGPKSAQRMVIALLEHKREAGKHLAQTLLRALHEIQHCQQCRNFSETPVCGLCRHGKRAAHLLCVVEKPIDVAAIESTGFNGYYFVLMGKISPLDGVTPEMLGFEQLKTRINSEELEEVIIATSTTIEGETTAHLIAQMAKQAGKMATRIAHGVPMGGELDYIDAVTLTHALSDRRRML